MAVLERRVTQESRISSDIKPHPGRRMTEEEFVEWCDEDTKAEWDDGEVIVMSPANKEHVELNGWTLTLGRLFVEEHDLGVILGPEYSVRLPRQRRRRVPDLLFVARGRIHILRDDCVDGAPDAIFEIVSPDSQTRDRRKKFQNYEQAGVPEYWIMDPICREVEPYTLGADGRYKPIEPRDGRLHSRVIRGFHIRPEWLWPPRPKVMRILRELNAARTAGGRRTRT